MTSFTARVHRAWRQRAVTAPFLGLLVVIGLLFLAVACTPDTGDEHDPAEVWVNAGYRLGDTTRSATLDVCELDPTAVECSSDGTIKAEAVPTIASTGLLSDLRTIASKSDECTGGRGAQFPADQIAVTAANGAPGQLAVTVTVTPNADEEVEAGTYCGFVAVNRSTAEGKPAGPPLRIPVAVAVGDRYGIIILLRVVLTLLLGAGLGFAIKWFTDNLDGLAAAIRTLDRARLIGGPTLTLPTELLADVLELRALVDAGDAQGARAKTAELSALDEHAAQLRGWAAITNALMHAVGALANLTRPLPPGVDADRTARLVEFRTLLDERLAQDFDPTATVDRDSAAATRARVLVEGITAWNAGGADADLAAALAAAAPPPAGLAGAVSSAPGAPGADSRPKTSVVYWLAARRTLVLGLFGIVVAVAVGLSQFVTDADFNNRPSQYLTLFLLAFGAQLAGVTLAQLAGKLSPPAASTG